VTVYAPNGTTVLGTATADPTTGAYQVNLSTPQLNGEQLKVTATDTDGESLPTPVTAPDTTPPENITVDITGISDDTGTTGDFVTLDNTLTVTGTISRALETGEKVEVQINGVWTAVTMTTATTWTITDPTAHSVSNVTYNARVTDTANNVGATDSQVVKVVEIQANDDIAGLQAKLTPINTAVNTSESSVTVALEGFFIGADSSTESSAYEVGAGSISTINISMSQVAVGGYVGALDMLVFKYSEVSGIYELDQTLEDFGFAVAIIGGLASGSASNVVLSEGKYVFVLSTGGLGVYAGIGALGVTGTNADYGDVRTVGNVITQDAAVNPNDVTDTSTGVAKVTNVVSETGATGTVSDTPLLDNAGKPVVNGDGETVTVATKVDGAYGTLTIYSNGGYIYDRTTPEATDVGKVDTFTYTITDEYGHTSTAELNIQIGSDNPANGLVFDPADPSADAKYTIDAVNDTKDTSAALSVVNPVTALAYDYPYTNSYITSPDSSADRAQIDYSGTATGITSTVTSGIFGSTTDTNYSNNFTVAANSLLKLSYHNDLPGFSSSTATMSLYVQKLQADGITWKTIATDTMNISRDNQIGQISIANNLDTAGTYRMYMDTNVGNQSANSTFTIDFDYFTLTTGSHTLTKLGSYNTITEGALTNGNVLTNDLGSTFAAKVTSVDMIGATTVTTAIGTATTSVAGQYGTLTMNQNGTYTYDTNNKITDLGKTEQFKYKVVTNDNNSTDTADLSILLKASGVIMNDSNTATTLTGTANSDLIVSRGGSETITSGAGNDTLIYNLLDKASANGGHGQDVWADFSKASSTTTNVNMDFIDITGLLSDQTGLTNANIGNYVKVNYNGTDTVISIDRDGGAGTWSEAQLLTLKNVNTTLQELIDQNQIIW
jgi:VCBS repeat-containing protein